MANVTHRRTGELVRKLFDILIAHPGGLRASDALSVLANAVTLSEYEKGDYDTGGRRFERIVRFATVDCVKAGWLAKDKGNWDVTEAGQAAFAAIKDPEDFYREARRLYAVWKRARDAIIASEPPSAEEEIADAAESLSVTFEQADEQAWAQIDAYLATSDPYEFQQIVADLLRGMGYHVSWVAPPGKDGGVDIIGHTDPLGAQGPRIKVQVKRSQSKVDVDVLRSFVSTVGGSDVGLFVCLAGFTKGAEELARAQETRFVTLLDTEKFVNLWIEYYGKLRDEARQRLPLTPIYFLTPK